MIAGVFLLQVTWAYVVPAFGGIDEIDHAYRAASVAEGYWAPPLEETKFGRGTLIRVPQDIVAAAHDRCVYLPYTQRDNCRAASEPDSEGNVLVASAASRYNPVYYGIVGTIARPFEGAAALYAMRLATAALAAIFLGCAIWVASRFARSSWPMVGVISALTPVVLYATSVAAPNGVQMAAGLLMWTCGVALLRSASRGHENVLFSLFGAAVAAVLITHSSGPMWVVLTLAALAVLRPQRVREHWQTRRRAFVILGVWIGVAAGASVAWILSQRTNLSGDRGHFEGLTTGDMTVAMVLWVFQAVGALPFRNEWVPVPVFAISLVTFAIFVIAAAWYARPRQRIVMAYVVLTFFAVPAVLTIMSFEELGLAWQGRYTLPFAFGLPIVAAAALDARASEFRRLRVMIPVTVVGFALTQAIAMISVVERQGPGWPETHTAGAPPQALLAAAAALALALITGGMVRARRSEPAETEPAGAIR